MGATTSHTGSGNENENENEPDKKSFAWGKVQDKRLVWKVWLLWVIAVSQKLSLQMLLFVNMVGGVAD
jgi:cytoskeletal protein RodZ